MNADLHIHLGGAVPASVLWEILHDQGLQTTHDRFEDFQNALTTPEKGHKSLDEFLGRYFHITEAIQSSPQAMAQSVYQAVAKAHRRSHLELIELRFNPAKRLRGGLHSPDAILLAALQGLEKASLHYGVRTAAILSLGRDCSYATNLSIVESAIRWVGKKNTQQKAAGVVGIDMAGPESKKLELDSEWLKTTAHLFSMAKEGGLKTTYHVGETIHTGWEGVRNVVNQIRPNRIGHGIELRKAPAGLQRRTLEALASTNTCLEICPTVNLATGSATSANELRKFCIRLHQEGVPFAICTDNPYLVHTNSELELDKLLPGPENPAREWAKACAFNHSFHPAKAGQP